MKKAIIIDGNSLMFRCYYGTINQVDFFIKNNIFPTNYIKTMMLILFKILESNNYDYAVIAFDHKDINFRKEEFDEYKKNRKKLPNELLQQIEPIKSIMPLFGLNSYCISGIEADDVVGSSSKLLNQNGIHCEIYSSDNDMLQLVKPNCDVIQFKKGINETTRYNTDNFSSLYYELKPDQVVDLKAISGDRSDNLPGIKGVGVKTALNLLSKFNSLEKIYESIDFVEPLSLKQKLKENKEIALKCKKLATIVQNYFDDKEINQFSFKGINYSEIKKVIEKYHFKGFEKYLGDK